VNFDIIGAVHGQYDKLVGLLVHLAYRDSAGAWRHPSRTAIFVGDLIDRGPKQLATVDLVRTMVEAGSAHCILGNHEFNAIAWVTPDPEHPGKFLRDHHEPGNREQHQTFLDVVEGTPRQKGITNWFKTLPLWLDLPGLRVVHACWHQESMDRLKPLLGPNHTLTDELILGIGIGEVGVGERVTRRRAVIGQRPRTKSGISRSCTPDTQTPGECITHKPVTQTKTKSARYQ
jgi:hypothetical protein